MLGIWFVSIFGIVMAWLAVAIMHFKQKLDSSWTIPHAMGATLATIFFLFIGLIGSM